MSPVIIKLIAIAFTIVILAIAVAEVMRRYKGAPMTAPPDLSNEDKK